MVKKGDKVYCYWVDDTRDYRVGYYTVDDIVKDHQGGKGFVVVENEGFFYFNNKDNEKAKYIFLKELRKQKIMKIL